MPVSKAASLLLAGLLAGMPAPLGSQPLLCAAALSDPAATAGESKTAAEHGSVRLNLPHELVATAELSLSMSREPIAVTRAGALAGWARRVRGGSFATIECAETAELRGAILCLFNDIVVGNLAFYRAAAWIEGTRAVPAHHFAAGYASYHDVIGPPARYVDGFDLQWHDLAGYRDAASTACRHDAASCLTVHETALFDHLLEPLSRQRGDFVLLGAGYGKPAIIGHEILHAQYFLDARYRAITDCYFDRMLEGAERQEVIDDFKSEYDVGNPFLVRNEFQAYLLQEGETMHLSRLRARHRERLLALLRSAGIDLIKLGP